MIKGNTDSAMMSLSFNRTALQGLFNTVVGFLNTFNMVSATVVIC